MTLKEAKQAKALHAMWDMVVMHHSLESVLDTYHIRVVDLMQVTNQVEKKCNEHRARTKNGYKDSRTLSPMR